MTGIMDLVFCIVAILPTSLLGLYLIITEYKNKREMEIDK